MLKHILITTPTPVETVQLLDQLAFDLPIKVYDCVRGFPSGLELACINVIVVNAGDLYLYSAKMIEFLEQATATPVIFLYKDLLIDLVPNIKAGRLTSRLFIINHNMPGLDFLLVNLINRSN